MEPETFEQLFDEHAQPLLAFLTYRVGDRATAEDLLSDTFERALRSRRGFDRSRGAAKSWLYAIALNLLRDGARRSAAEQRAIAAVGGLLEGETAGPAHGIEVRHTVAEALTVLSIEEREAVALRYGADLTVPEVADLLGVPLTTAEGRIYRALRKLGTVLRAG